MRREVTVSYYIPVVTTLLLLFVLPQAVSANVPNWMNLTINGSADAFYCNNPCAVQLTPHYATDSMPRWFNFTKIPPGNNTPVTFGYGSVGMQYVFGVGNWSVTWSSTNASLSDAPPFSMNTTPPVWVNVSPTDIPIVSFTANPMGGSTSASVQFTDGSSGATAWNWSFTNISEYGGNGTQVWFSQAESPTHTFGMGNWSIVLNASNQLGWNISTSSFIINVGLPVIPVASFTANTTNPMVTFYGEPTPIQFTDTSSGYPTTWSWQYVSADGNVSNNTPVTFSSAQNPTVSLGVGSWLITLTASNLQGSNTSPPTRIVVSPWQLPVTQQQYFTPHKVRFECTDYLGAPIVGMNVSVIGVESSLGSLDWVPYLFGLNLNNTPILNTTMTATTGSDGAVVFVMIETEKYALHYTSPAKGIDETRYYYPKEESYSEIFWTESVVFATPTVAPCGGIVYYSNTTPNSTSKMDLHIRYYDCANNTANMTFYVTDITNNKMKTPLFTNNMSNPNNIDITYVVSTTNSTSYRYGITGRTTTGRPVYQESVISFNASQWRYNPLGAENGNQFASWFYNMISTGIIILFAMMFGRWSIKVAVIVVPMLALYFSTLYMGWLQTSGIIVITAVVLGVMAYLRFAEEESQL